MKIFDKIANLANKYGYTEILEKDFEQYVGKEAGIKTLRVFADLEDRDQYQEEESSVVEPEFDKMKSLMNNLNTFLGK